jgi:hypothetical protein
VSTLAVGRRKEGKSTLALWLAFQSHAAVFVFDPRGMFAGHVVRSPEELQNAIKEKLYADGQPIVYRFDTGNAETAFDEMADVLFPPQFTMGGFALIVDEAGELQGANQINDALRRAVAQHPTDGDFRVTIIQTSHRLSEYHGKCKALVDELYIFRTTHPRDLQALLDYTGDESVLPIVQDLPQHHCLRYKFARQKDGVAQYEVWDNPTVWYVPMSGSPSPQGEQGEGGEEHRAQSATLVESDARGGIYL